MLGIAAARLWSRRQYRRATPPSDRLASRQRLFLIGAGLAGMGWGALAVWLIPAGDATRQAFAAFLLAGVTAAAVSSLTALLPALLLFVTGALSPLVLRFFSLGAADKILQFSQADGGGIRLHTRPFDLAEVATEAVRGMLVELMGGEIGMASTPGKGSSFWFRLTLPLVEQAPDTETSSTEPRGPAVDSGALPSLAETIGEELIGELVATHLDSTSALLEVLSLAEANGDQATVHRLAHSLKSSSANPGAMSLSKMGLNLEQQAREDHVTDAADQIAAMRREFERVRQELNDKRQAVKDSIFFPPLKRGISPNVIRVQPLPLSLALSSVMSFPLNSNFVGVRCLIYIGTEGDTDSGAADQPALAIRKRLPTLG